MNFRLAEIGIILIALTNLPLVGIPRLGSLLSYILWRLVGDPMTMYSIFCAVTALGVILLISDRKGLLHRTKGSKIVSTILVISGLILIVESFFIFIASALVPSNGVSATILLFWAWMGLAFISGASFFFYGRRVWGYEHACTYG